MSNSLEKQLFQATALTFEGLGFLMVAPDLEEQQKAGSWEAAVEVGFRGPFSGKVVLAVSDGVLSNVMSNMLGDEAAASGSTRQDLLGELANVICGNVLGQVSPGRRSFDLSAPRPLPLAELKGWNEAPAGEIHVGLDDGRADVYLFVRSAGQKGPAVS